MGRTRTTSKQRLISWRLLRIEELEPRNLLNATSVLADFGALSVDPGSYESSSILVRFAPGALATNQALLQSMGMSFGPALSLVDGLYKINLPQTIGVEDAIGSLDSLAGVMYAEPNYHISIAAVPNDPDFSQLWGMNNVGQTGGTVDADIDAVEAWDVTTGDQPVVVAVIDSGVDYNHPDLADNIWTNPGEIPNNGVDDDNNGYIDDIHGYDFANNDNDPMDDNDHGTHVAGTIGAVANNGIGVAGVNWNVEIMAVKFISSLGFGTTEAAINAINYAVQNGASISNNSWGGGPYSQGLRDAIEAGIASDHIFVAAAGNNSSNNDSAPHYPSNYDLPNVIAVAATDHNDNLASFSNWGATTVDVAAPGVDVLSTVPGGGYATFSGTSMAAPHVTGVVSLMLGQNPSAPYADVISQLYDTVDPLAALAGITATGGRVNALAAVTGEPPPDNFGPFVTSASPSGSRVDPFDSIRVSFNESLLDGSFDLEDIIDFIGPNGSIQVLDVVPVAGSNNRTFDITFAQQSALGTYDLTFGPKAGVLSIIEDTNGNAMNQDRDSNNGELVDDQYVATVTITNEVRYDSSEPQPIFGAGQSFITISDSAVIGDLDIEINFTHGFVGALEVELTGPNDTLFGTTLTTGAGISGSNFIGTRFDDEATLDLSQGTSPYTGSFRPSGFLSNYDGQNIQGTWTLTVYDWLVADPWGWISSWSIIMSPQSEEPPPPPPPADPIYDFTASNYAAPEGDSTNSSSVVMVSRTGRTDVASSIDVVLTGQSATAGEDFTAGPVTIDFAADQTVKAVPIELLGDLVVEADETIGLSLTGGQVGTTNPTAVFTIINDDGAPTIDPDTAITEDDADDLLNIADDTVIYTLVFDKEIQQSGPGALDASDLSNAGSASAILGTPTTTDGIAWTVLVEASTGTTGDVKLQINQGALIEDLAGNALDTTTAIVDDATLVADLQSPNVSSITDSTGGAVTEGSSFTYRVTLSEIVSGIDSVDDFNLAGSTNATISGVSTVSGSVYDVTVATAGAGGEVLTLQVVDSGVTPIRDIAGNSIIPASDDNTVTVNGTSGGTFDVDQLTFLNDGFEVTFVGGPLDQADINIYRQPGLVDDDPDVQVIFAGEDGIFDNSDDVELTYNGSLFFGNSLRWIMTGPMGTTGHGMLPRSSSNPSLYRITLQSGDNAFENSSGDDLNGGSDYVAIVDIDTANPLPSEPIIFSLPDFSRGPGQDVIIPEGSPQSQGIPLMLSDGAISSGGVGSFDLVVRYNADRLNITGFISAPGFPSATFSDNSVGALGRADIEFVTTTQLSDGPVLLGWFDADVPLSPDGILEPIYGSHNILDVEITSLYTFDASFNITDESAQAVDDDALHLVANPGDTSGSAGNNDSTDSFLLSILNVSNNLNTFSGFGHYRNADPRLIADLNLDGLLNAGDSLILSLDNLSDIPQVPEPSASQDVADIVFASDEIVLAGSSSNAGHGSEEPLSVQIGEQANLTSAEDPSSTEDPSVSMAQVVSTESSDDVVAESVAESHHSSQVEEQSVSVPSTTPTVSKFNADAVATDIVAGPVLVAEANILTLREAATTEDSRTEQQMVQYVPSLLAAPTTTPEVSRQTGTTRNAMTKDAFGSTFNLPSQIAPVLPFVESTNEQVFGQSSYTLTTAGPWLKSLPQRKLIPQLTLNGPDQSVAEDEFFRLNSLEDLSDWGKLQDDDEIAASVDNLAVTIDALKQHLN